MTSASLPGLAWLIGGGLSFAVGLLSLRRGLLCLAERRVRAVMGRWTRRRRHAAAAGLLAATLLQSSSLTNLMIVNLVHAGWLSLPQSIAMMMGANVGTTTTAQLLSWQPEAAFFYAAPAALALWLFGRGRWRRIGMAAAGLACLLAGIDAIGKGMAAWGAGDGPPFVEAWMRRLGTFGPPGSFWPYLAGGAAVTAIVQSSSVTIGMAMAMASAGALGAGQGIAFMLGANVGTVVSTLLGALGASRPARQAAVADLAFNALGVLAVAPFLAPFAAVVARTGLGPARQIALAHGLFNVGSLAAGLAFLHPLTALVRRLVPDAPRPPAVPPNSLSGSGRQQDIRRRRGRIF